MRRWWWAVEADFQREYGLGPHDIKRLTRRRFGALLSGLSPDAMFRQMAGDELSIVDDPDQIRAALRSV